MNREPLNLSKIFKWSFRIITLLLTLYYLIFNRGGSLNTNYISNGIIILASSFAPDIIAKMLKLSLSSALDLFIQFFIFLSLFLGRMYGFYSLFTWWDLFLHLLSGVLIGILALAQLRLTLGEALFNKLSPCFVSLYVILFSIAGAAIWEFWEFAGDQLFGFDSQLNSLFDTMTDMLMGTISGLFVGFLAYVNIKFHKVKFLNGFIEGFVKN